MITVFGKVLHAKSAAYVQEVFDYLQKLGIEYVVEERYARHLRDEHHIRFQFSTYTFFDEVKSNTEMVFSMGGDGTILEAITFIGKAEIPIMGFNFGRLGFLANVSKEQIHQAIDMVNAGQYLIEKRSVLELNSNQSMFAPFPFALNEMTIQRKDQSSMITIHTFLNGELLNSYWADGLIISTPSGSTGYSLSCGGPIIYPSSENFVITPVAPHNLNVRPIVVSDDVVLSFAVTGRADSFLCTLDSRFESIDSTFELAIKKADFYVKLVRLSDMNFIAALKNKLNWGADLRN